MHPCKNAWGPVLALECGGAAHIHWTCIDQLKGNHQVEDHQLREFGLFAGGDTNPDSGILINHRVHPRIDLDDGFPIERILRLTF